MLSLISFHLRFFIPFCFYPLFFSFHFFSFFFLKFVVWRALCFLHLLSVTHKQFHLVDYASRMGETRIDTSCTINNFFFHNILSSQGWKSVISMFIVYLTETSEASPNLCIAVTSDKCQGSHSQTGLASCFLHSSLQQRSHLSDMLFTDLFPLDWNDS